MGTYGYSPTGNHIQYVTVGQSGTFQITAYGASGGNSSNGNTGGYGAKEAGTFSLTQGEKLELVVGHAGFYDGTAAGGGGGTFIFANTGPGGAYVPLIVAGGGGGGANYGSGSGGTVGAAGTGHGGYGGALYNGVGFGGGGGASINQNGYNSAGTYGAGLGGSTGPTWAQTNGPYGGAGGFGGGGTGSGYGGGGGAGFTGGQGGGTGRLGGYGGTSYVNTAQGSYLAAQSQGAQHAGNGSVVITPNAVCFVAGTLIRTSRSKKIVEVPVEDLRVGDFVVTASGARRPIKWLGHRTIDCRNHPFPQQTWPVRITAHAFGDYKPARDLYLSPGHSISVTVLEEVLIPACVLVNGSTIQQVEVDEVTYWHVELDSHDITLAENLACESYLDMGNRGFFAEADVVDLDASLAALTYADFCRPFHSDGPIIDVVRSHLDARRATLGWTLVHALMADLHLIADGVRIEPAICDLTARFSVPAGAHDVWIVSETSRPCEISDSVDARDLGLCLAALTIDDGLGTSRTIALDDPLLVVGFHHVEEDVRRWTAGRARLPAALWDDCPNGISLCLELGMPALPRWVAPAEPMAVRQAA